MELAIATARTRQFKIARLAAFAAACAGGVILIGSGFASPGTPDSEAYRLASLRLLHGEPLYLAMSPDAVEAYRYAPWFAALYIPFALLPFGPAAWFGITAVAWAYTAWATFRLGGHAGLILGIIAFAGFGSLPGGNVAGVMLALLIATRMHPAAVGLFASLKVYPLLFVAGYIAERRWRDAALAVVVTVILWAPALLFDLSGYVTTPGNGGISLWAIEPELWLVQDAVLLGAVTYLAWRGSHWCWLACAAAVPLAAPRVYLAGAGYFTAAACRQSIDGALHEPMVDSHRLLSREGPQSEARTGIGGSAGANIRTDGPLHYGHAGR